ncbi:T9SS type A sorting domain-containing protein [Maribellus comscasis]|nr:T9SS type A sorting domain-containing protein [Maribellus comscasis]
MKKVIWVFVFFVLSMNMYSQNKITAWEYWFDDNYSEVVNQSVGVTRLLNIDEAIDVSSLEFGLHTLNFRVQDERGIWGSPGSCFFTLFPETLTPAMQEITAYEYWYDSDYSSRTKQNISASSVFSFNDNLSVSSLETGLHAVHFRFQNEGGISGPAVSRFFVIEAGSTTPVVKKITTLEYWYNNDYSSVHLKNITPSEFLSLDNLLDVSDLDNGLNTVHFRFKDENGDFSPAFSKFFTKYNSTNITSDNKIVVYRYWLDSDLATMITDTIESPSKDYLLHDNLEFPDNPSGEHFFTIQFMDEHGRWSSSVGDTVAFDFSPWAELSVSDTTVCVNEPLSFYSDTTDVTDIVWNFGDGTTSIEFNPRHSYIQDGKYEVTATVSHTPSGKSEIVTLSDSIHVFPVKISTVDTAICKTEIPFTFGAQSLSSSGTYYETFVSSSGCDSTVTLNLTVKDTFLVSDVVSICENELPYIFGTKSLTSSGTYTEVFNTITGCDSTVTLDFTVNDTFLVNIIVSILQDELPFSFGGQTLTTGGTYTEIFKSVSGCDSTVILNLSVNTEDITPPEVYCNPITIVLDRFGKYELSEFDIEKITAGTTDNADEYDDLIFTILPDSFSCEQAEKDVEIMVIAKDQKENTDTCYTTVRVKDETLPAIKCEDVVLELDENGYAGLNINDGYKSVFDACGIRSVVASQDAFDCNDIGINRIGITVTDNNGNTNTCYTNVDISDALSPSFTPVTNITVTADKGECEAVVEYPEIVALDNCKSPVVKLAGGLGGTATFPVGTTTEKWVAVDNSGNTDTLTFEITVLPGTVNPEIDSIPDVEMIEDSGWMRIVLTGIDDGSGCSDDSVEFVFTTGNPQLVESYMVDYETGSDSAVLMILPAPDANGFSIADLLLLNRSTGKSFADTFNLNINAENDPPRIIRELEDFGIKPGDTVTVNLGAGVDAVFEDPDDNDTFTLTLLSEEYDDLPAWLNFYNDTLFASPAVSDTGCVSLRLIATDLAGDTTVNNFTICVGFTVGINHPEKSNLKIYPNPTSGIVYVEFPSNVGEKLEVSVFNATGREVLNQSQINTGRFEIEMSNFVSGVYFIKIKGKDKVLPQKLILSR